MLQRVKAIEAKPCYVSARRVHAKDATGFVQGLLTRPAWLACQGLLTRPANICDRHGITPHTLLCPRMLDLHTHSSVSDGSDTPERIPELALEAGCSAVALTDHDSTDGLARAGLRAAQLGIELVRGCEISCVWEGGSMHVLIYFIDAADTPIEEELVHLRADRAERNRRMLDKLGVLGISLTMDEISAEAGSGSIGRPHFARVLAAKGVVSTPKEAFDKLVMGLI